jgi:DNA replication initiation complex subunit (GINS family)
MEYDELYEVLRKEKYSEALQSLDKKFVIEFSEYLKSLRVKGGNESDLFSDDAFQNKKQLENSIALFKGLILRRKKKILNMVFVAAETGIMKRDYENMFDFEKKIFDNLVKAFEEGDKELSSVLNGKNEDEKIESKMVIFSENVEEFVDMNGKVIGPFNKGMLVNLDTKVGEILVEGGKADFVDE